MSDWHRWWVPLVGGLFMASACGESDGCDCASPAFQAVVAGNNVTPHKNPADTAARATVTIVGYGPSYTFTYALGVAPHGTVDGIRILQGTVTKGTICSAAPCAAFGVVKGVSDTTLYRSMRNVEVVVRVYTDSDPLGAAEGAITPVSP
ncbi:MAG TPA: hypothetical protein VLV16_07115 [Gemmatimonadales bacterium]|nr:hypothetical protein [Gemmatimonadales bacterium]